MPEVINSLKYQIFKLRYVSKLTISHLRTFLTELRPAPPSSSSLFTWNTKPTIPNTWRPRTLLSSHHLLPLQMESSGTGSNNDPCVQEEKTAARYVISVRVNPKTNVGLGVPQAGTSLSWIPDPETGKWETAYPTTEYTTTRYAWWWQVLRVLCACGRGTRKSSSHQSIYTLKVAT